jgi:hypothetical protein
MVGQTNEPIKQLPWLPLESGPLRNPPFVYRAHRSWVLDVNSELLGATKPYLSCVNALQHDVIRRVFLLEIDIAR